MKVRSMTQRDTTVVKFPRSNLNVSALPTDMKEADAALVNTKLYYVQSSLNMIMHLVINHLELAGFDTINQNDLFTVKECALIAESIRSFMFTSYDLNHPMQRVADAIFIEKDPEEDKNAQKDESIHLDIADAVTIDLKDLKENVLRC
jgi:hypothetical protein